MYIVISGQDDEHIPYVQRHLNEPFTLINTRGILDDGACSYRVDRHGETKILLDGRELTEVKSVWYRRLMLVQDFELPVPDGQKKYAANSIKFFNHLVFPQFSDAFWVSDFFAIRKASDKLWQLQMAAKLGFNVPDTLFTASKDQALAFVKSHKSVIAKPNHSSHFIRNDKEYVFYTSHVDESTDFSGLHLAPAILQEAIDVKTELRITVVGNEIFAASIDGKPSNAIEHVRDWRLTSLKREATFAPFDLPRRFTEKCVALVKELGLQYGAIDIIIDRNDKMWFLENNPNGQWAFVEDATSQPIGESVARLLMNGKR